MFAKYCGKKKDDEDDSKDKKSNIDELKDATVGSKMILKNLNVNIKQGEFVCIIGDTACGKSSFL